MVCLKHCFCWFLCTIFDSNSYIFQNSPHWLALFVIWTKWNISYFGKAWEISFSEGNPLQYNAGHAIRHIQTFLYCPVKRINSFINKSVQQFTCECSHLIECPLSHPREASAIRAENFHTDDVNLSRIQTSLPNGSLHKMQLKTSTVSSWLTMSTTLTQTKSIC